MKKNLYLNTFIFFAFITVFSSCVDQKKYIYFQRNAHQPDTINVAATYIPKIQPGDILDVYTNSLNSAASSFFNPLSTAAANVGTGSGLGASAPIAAAGQSPANGLLVDEAGLISMPIIGTIKVAGLTTSEARDTIKNRLKFYTKEPTVNVRFLNYKVSILGEVAHPAVYVIPNERVTLPEALSMAGDLTIYAKRDDVIIVRDNVNGKKEFGKVNLNTREVFNSPYYYLHANDLIYVANLKGKSAQSNESTFRITSLIIAAVTAISLILYRFK